MATWVKQAAALRLRYVVMITTWYLHSHRIRGMFRLWCICLSFLPFGAFPEGRIMPAFFHAGLLRSSFSERPAAVGLARTEGSDDALAGIARIAFAAPLLSPKPAKAENEQGDHRGKNCSTLLEITSMKMRDLKLGEQVS